jgi:hypothetical protein
MKRKNLIFSCLLAILLIVLLQSGCVGSHQYRYKSAVEASDNCDAGSSLYPSNNETEKTPGAKCFEQKHSLPNIGSDAGESTSYSLNFLEFDETGQLFDERQFQSIFDIVRSQDTYLIVFIHGWRHDAAIADEDVRRFRTLLGYAAAFVKQRSLLDRYEHTKVAGLFVGWRGRAVADCGALCTPYVAPTFFGRKATSDVLGPHVVGTLRKLEGAFAQNALQRQASYANRMLVIGHSFGGNILASALSSEVIKQLERHEEGDTFSPPLGDLALLINPASEAKRWTTIQEKVRALGKVRGDNRLTYELFRLFPATQRPVLVSMTSACSWPEGQDVADDLRNRKVACDVPTGTYFPIARYLSGYRDADQVKTIGHLDPDPQQPPRSPLNSLGTSHEIELNGSAKIESNYQNAAYGKDTAKCAIIDGWLRKAIDDKSAASASGYGEGWDTGHTAATSLTPSSRKGKTLFAQVRHSTYRDWNGRIISGPRDPFWNMRALDTAISGHGGYMSYRVWCLVNQIVLDDPTSSTYSLKE